MSVLREVVEKSSVPCRCRQKYALALDVDRDGYMWITMGTCCTVHMRLLAPCGDTLLAKHCNKILVATLCMMRINRIRTPSTLPRPSEIH
mmetsp:Transcript_44205/g.116164  ORF Transcript_44205/g.116164 Transcript_44205/m.116164 type:complete len:90 (-) Transcript_44205:352-621(-)